MAAVTAVTTAPDTRPAATTGRPAAIRRVVTGRPTTLTDMARARDDPRPMEAGPAEPGRRSAPRTITSTVREQARIASRPRRCSVTPACRRPIGLRRGRTTSTRIAAATSTARRPAGGNLAIRDSGNLRRRRRHRPGRHNPRRRRPGRLSPRHRRRHRLGRLNRRRRRPGRPNHRRGRLSRPVISIATPRLARTVRTARCSSRVRRRRRAAVAGVEAAAAAEAVVVVVVAAAVAARLLEPQFCKPLGCSQRATGFNPIPICGEYCHSPETSVCLGKELPVHDR